MDFLCANTYGKKTPVVAFPMPSEAATYSYVPGCMVASYRHMGARASSVLKSRVEKEGCMPASSASCPSVRVYVEPLQLTSMLGAGLYARSVSRVVWLRSDLDVICPFVLA